MTRTGLLSIGDELLSGAVANTNATWLADQLTDRGVRVGEIRVIPDAVSAIETAVTDFVTRFDRTITTGGLGSTPDDVTITAVAAALDRPLEAHPAARAAVEESVREIKETHLDFNHDIDAAAQFPTGARIIPNDAGIMPGCVVESVYVLPGIPIEMKAVFEGVEHEFAGNVDTRTVTSDTPESHLDQLLSTLHDRFDVDVGCYPTDDRKRITVTGSDAAELERAYEWLKARPEVDGSE